MGVIEFFQRGVGEMMVARPEGTKSQVVWKHPERTLPNRAQLTVDADEKAVFFRDGKVVSVLGPGRTTLETSNFRFLSNLVDKFTGGNVFVAQVFFVNTREQTGIRFGGRIGHVEDPKSGVPVETMVHGEFSFRVTDPEKLIVGLVGMGRAQAFQVRSWLKEQVLKVLRDGIAERIVKEDWPLLDVTSGAYTEEIEEKCLGDLAEHVESYGVEVVRFGNFVICIDEGDADNLKRLYTDQAYLKAVGGVGNYRRFAAGKAMLGAGEGLSKGGGFGGGALLAGTGLGMGLGLSQLLVCDPHGGQWLTPATAGIACPACTATVAPGKYCSSCGEALTGAGAKAEAYCTSCGSPLAPDSNFCGQCGRKRG